MTKWIIREQRIPTALLTERIGHAVFVEVDGVENRFSREGMHYIDCREMVLMMAVDGDTYVEENLDGSSTDVFMIVTEDKEVRNLRISDDVASARKSSAHEDYLDHPDIGPVVNLWDPKTWEGEK